MMTERPHTPAQLAAALRAIADQLDTMSDRDQPCTSGGIGVTLGIQPGTVADVDRFAVALFGKPARPFNVGGSWHHTTHFHPDHIGPHPTGVDVGVYCGVDDPAVAAAKAERDALQAELEELRAARERYTEARTQGRDGVESLARALIPGIPS